ncbi:MAG: helicase-associated domain-containing protein [Treponema sp.]|nr:helicase-associated domain-containing protein [Treponema sp.]
MINRANPAADKHVQKVLEWRESFATMPDSHFFEIIRMYLGEVKTPYNKQKLIEELSSFLRKEQTQRTLISLLSDTDLQIISAVHFVPGITQEKLASFFPNVLSFAALYDRLLNLEERLILFCHKDSVSQKNVIDINPLLEGILLPFLKVESVLPLPEYAEKYDGSSLSGNSLSHGLSPLMFASFLAFVNSNPDVCKIDGTLKKRAADNLAKIFPGCEKLLSFLVRSCINLSLIKESEKGFSVDFERCRNFANLSWLNQLVYLCTASCAHLSRSELKKQSELFLSVYFSMPQCGYTEEVLVRSGLLAASVSREEKPVTASRFSQIIRNAGGMGGIGGFAGSSLSETGQEDVSGVNPMDRLVEVASAFGLLLIAGKTEAGKEIFIRNPEFGDDVNNAGNAGEPEPKVLSIDAGFSVTVLPGLCTRRLLPLIQFMEIKRCDSVATFEINRKSVLGVLDSGYSIEKIIDLLTENSNYPVPQNLRVCLDEWNAAFSSAALYSGFVLKVNAENQLLSEKNPNLKPHIKTVLAPGIFLLDVKDSAEAEELMAKCGIDFIGQVKNTEEKPQLLPFTALSSYSTALRTAQGEDMKTAQTEQKPFERGTEADRASFFIQMRKELDAMNLSPEQKEGLELRIRRKIVLNPVQLRANSVRLEKNEAHGMDFIGKIRIVERAMATKSMIEISGNQKKPDDVHDTVPPRILGMPLGIEKKEGDSFVRIRLEPSQEEVVFSLGQADFVKRLRGSFLEEGAQ